MEEKRIEKEKERDEKAKELHELIDKLHYYKFEKERPPSSEKFKIPEENKDSKMEALEEMYITKKNEANHLEMEVLCFWLLLMCLG